MANSHLQLRRDSTQLNCRRQLSWVTSASYRCKLAISCWCRLQPSSTTYTAYASHLVAKCWCLQIISTPGITILKWKLAHPLLFSRGTLSVHTNFVFMHFTRESSMLRASLPSSERLSVRLSVRPSVRPSHSWAVSKRCKLGSRNLQCGLPQGL